MPRRKLRGEDNQFNVRVDPKVQESIRNYCDANGFAPGRFIEVLFRMYMTPQALARRLQVLVTQPGADARFGPLADWVKRQDWLSPS